MSPITHLLSGWLVAAAAPLDRRCRTLVTVAAAVPDVDAFGAVAIAVGLPAGKAWWSDYHHVLGHNLALGLVFAIAAFFISGRRLAVAILCLASFHLHLLGDIAGGKGPDGYAWPIPYLLPFSDSWQFAWRGQWPLNAWQNFALTGAMIVATFALAWRRGYSPLEMVSARADTAFVSALRRRYGFPAPGSRSGK